VCINNQLRRNSGKLLSARAVVVGVFIGCALLLARTNSAGLL
jgi:hypothetical protein